MRRPSSVVGTRQRRNFINGRITRRPRNPPRPQQTRSRPLSTPASVQQPSIETSLERESISDIYVKDHPISLNYNTCSTPGFLPPNKAWHEFQFAADRLPNRRQRRPPPPQENREATTLLDEIRENFRLWARHEFTLVQTFDIFNVVERDFRLVLNDHYFCDDLITYYFQLIEHRCRTLKPAFRAQRVVALSAFQTRRIIRGAAPFPPLDADVQFILFPVRYVADVECPWSLVIADIANTKIIHYDPVEHGDARYIIALEDELERLYPNTINAWTREEAVVSFKCPDDDKQLSGLFICNFANTFVQRKIPTLKEENVDLTILHFLNDICRNAIPLQEERNISVSNIREFLVRHLEDCLDLEEHIIVSTGNVELRNTDAVTLFGDCFLSPNVVDMYFILIQNRWMGRRRLNRNLPELRVIRSTYSSHFINGTETMEMIFRRVCHGGLTYFPVCDPVSNQWVLLVIDEPNRIISYYDPRRNVNEEQETNVPLYARSMLERYGLFSGFELEVVTDIPAVGNQYDSGIYVCRYARQLVESMRLYEGTFSDLSLRNLRETMTFELFDGELRDLQEYRI